MSGLQWLLGFLAVFLLVTAVGMMVLVSNEPTPQVGVQNGISLAIFSPATYVDAQYNYYTAVNNTFNTDRMWFYVYLENITMNLVNGSYYEHYALKMTMTDSKGNIMLGYNDAVVYDHAASYDSLIPYESVRFDMDISGLPDGIYNVRMDVVDYQGSTQDYKDDYFVVKR